MHETVDSGILQYFLIEMIAFQHWSSKENINGYVMFTSFCASTILENWELDVGSFQDFQLNQLSQTHH